MTAALTILWRALTFGVTLPVWAFLALGIWVKFDQGQTIRRAVKDYVAGAEIEGLKARIDAAQQVAAFERGKAQALEAANKQFEQARQDAERESERLANELADLQSRPAPDGCTVDDDLLGRLRQ